MLSEKSIDLFKAFIQNATKLGAFIVVLWQLSGVQTFELYGRSWTIHGYLVWIALIWSLACTLVTHIIGRWLQPLNVERQHREADYRATLLRIRDHAEQIALYRGEQAEKERLHERFGRIRDNWRELITREFKLEVFSTAYLRVSFFIPVVATLPMYLAKTMSFGSMMQAGTAFSSVQDGFGWFMDYYKRIMEWAAVVERLGRFQEAMAAVDGQKPAGADDGAQMPRKAGCWHGACTSACSHRNGCWSMAAAGWASPRCCARWLGCGPGMQGISGWLRAAFSCRSAPTCRWAVCGRPWPIPAARCPTMPRCSGCWT